MIEAVLQDYLGRPVSGGRMLDIGCGNGGISAHFAQCNEQYGVDVVDRRRDKSDIFELHLVKGELLPFDDSFFDIILSNHVIEHVSDQGLHLSEMKRVLRPDGIIYLATPNRSSPIMEGHVGNSSVLKYREMKPLFLQHGLFPREYSVAILKKPFFFMCDEAPIARFMPRLLLNLMRPLFPSHVFVLSSL